MSTHSSPTIDDLLTHGAWLRRLASSLVIADGEAEDLVQETWLAALARGPERNEEARAWLARVLRNQASSRARKRAARQHREEKGARTEGLPSTAELASRADVSRQLVGHVLTLPEEPQRILLAHYFEGLSCAEIARRLERPGATVRSQLKRGLDELRRRLDAENGGERERWLGALTPLALPGQGITELGTTLALSAGARVALGVGVALLTAGVWWANRVPGPPTPPPLAGTEQSASSREPQEKTDSRLAAESETTSERQVAHPTAPLPPQRPIHGQLLHPETGEAVIWYELGVLPQEQVSLFEGPLGADTPIPEPPGIERVRTDQEGRFTTQVQYTSGAYAIVPLEDWTTARIPADLDRIRQPRPAFLIDHDATSETPQPLELATGPVFAIDCPRALELGAENLVAIYSYLDHFPPGYFRPSQLQTEPVPFVRMHTDFAPSHRDKVTNLRLVSADGVWSGSVPMEIPESIALQHVSIDLEARAVVEVDLDFDGRKPPLYLDLQYWQGSVDPTAEGAPEPDIVEIQAKFDGTDLEQALVKYIRPGLSTIGIKATGSSPWYQVLELVPGPNRLSARLQADPRATGRIEGRVLYPGDRAPEPVVRVIANGTLDGEPTFQMRDLVFERQEGLWVGEFLFTHLAPGSHVVWFDKGGPATHEPKAFAVEPDRVRVEVNGPPLEFELHTDLTTTRLQVKAKDRITGKKLREFGVDVVVPGSWVRSRQADAKAGRAKLKLLGDLEGGIAMVSAEGYARRDLPLAQAVEGSRGLELDVELAPGWGGPVYATHADSGKPLAEVEVLLDGFPVGKTDESGSFQVEVELAPQRVEFVREGYRVASQAGWAGPDGKVIAAEKDPRRKFFAVSLREE